MKIISSKRRRRRRISITAGEESVAKRNLRFHSKIKNVLEEGEHKHAVQLFPMFALFEDDFTIIHGYRRLRCLRQLNQRLWIFAAFGDAWLGR